MHESDLRQKRKPMKATTCLLALLLLSACASSLSDMQNNKFTTLVAAPAPKTIQGVWSGNMGPYLMSIKIKEDGNALMAYSYGTNNVLSRAKYQPDGKLYIQDGSKVDVSANAPDELNVKNPYLFGQTSKFRRDEQLQEAPLFAVDELRKF